MRAPGYLLLAAWCWSAAAMAQPNVDLTRVEQELEQLRAGQKALHEQLDAIQKLLAQRLPAPAPQPEPFRETLLTTDGSYSMGDRSARVAIIEYTDYQCPYCSRHSQQTVPQIVAEYVKTGRVRYIQRDYPLESIHPLAFRAAEAARCGGEQGKFWEMRERLFLNQNALSAPELKAHAQAVGLDVERFGACLTEGRQASRIRADIREGQKNGIGATPGFLIGLVQADGASVKATQRMIGAQGYGNFKAAIEELLRGAGR